jgi:hypothetical protein
LVDEDLDMALWLQAAAPDAGGLPGLAVLQDETGAVV